MQSAEPARSLCSFTIISRVSTLYMRTELTHMASLANKTMKTMNMIKMNVNGTHMTCDSPFFLEDRCK